MIISGLILPSGLTFTHTLPGQTEFITVGSYSWVCPPNVTSVCAVAIGGGGGGGRNLGGGASGGGGAGLAWRNNISVTPGVSYTVVVGAGGTMALNSGYTGGASYFIDPSIVAGYGGGGGGQFTLGGGGAGGTYVGDGGGNGGSSAWLGVGYFWTGGGGAGGYSGNGGDGGEGGIYAARSGNGGGGGGGSLSASQGGAGGGVGIYGQGGNGGGGTYNTTPAGIQGGGGSGGGGGIPYNFTPPTNGMMGGLYGGGAGSMTAANTSFGGNGAVRIIWGEGRAFPSTSAGNL